MSHYDTERDAEREAMYAEQTQTDHTDQTAIQQSQQLQRNNRNNRKNRSIHKRRILRNHV